MMPVIFKISIFEIRSYGLMLMFAFLAGIYVFVKEGAKNNIEKEKILDLSFYIIITSIISSRLVFILINFPDYIDEPFSVLWPISGLSFHGGLLGGILVSIYFAKKNKISFLKLADSASPSLAIGTSIARIGCFLNGCCAGHTSSLPWAIKFKDTEYFAHPSQLYDSILNIILFIFLIFYNRKYKSRQGSLFFLYLIGASLTRFFVEWTRKGVSAKVLFFGLTEAQILCIVIFIFSIIAIKFIKNKEE